MQDIIVITIQLEDGYNQEFYNVFLITKFDEFKIVEDNGITTLSCDPAREINNIITSAWIGNKLKRGTRKWKANCARTRRCRHL